MRFDCCWCCCCGGGVGVEVNVLSSPRRSKMSFVFFAGGAVDFAGGAEEDALWKSSKSSNAKGFC
jgi:hypothetical protein